MKKANEQVSKTNKVEEELKMILKTTEYKDFSNFEREQKSIKIAQEKYLKNVKKNIEKDRINEIDAVAFLNNKIVNGFLIKMIEIINKEYSLNRQKKREFYETIKELKDHSFITNQAITNYNKIEKLKDVSEQNIIKLHDDLKNVDFARLAEITCNAVIQSGYNRESVTTASKKIGTAFNDEMVFDYFRDNYKHLFKKKTEDYKYNSNQQIRTNMIFLSNKMEHFSYEHLTSDKRILVGRILIELFLENNSNVAQVNSYLISKNNKRKKRNTTSKVEIFLTDEFKKDIDRSIGLRQMFSNEFKPMTIKPKDWTSVYSGGYWSIGNLTMIKANKNKLKKMSQYDLSFAMNTLNKIQSVPYKINHQVLDVMHNLFHNSIDNITNEFNDEVLPVEIKESTKPQKPPILMQNPLEMEDNIKAIYDKELELWKKKAHAWYYDKASSETRRMLMRNILSIAHEYKNSKLYFPHQFDTRGRIYAVPKYLNPQSNDFSKGLLMFNNSQKITENGVKALKFHLANVFATDDIDKEDIETKVEWSNRNEDMFIRIAQDPYSNKDWQNADKPWQALAACFEFLNYKKDPENFRTSLIIDIDGSNNGLQHYAAILRDVKTAKYTNIANNLKPQDSYKTVANVIRNNFMENYDTFSKDEQNLIKKILAFGFGRKEVKQPTMTTAYASTKNGHRGQITKVYKKKINSGADMVFKDRYEMYEAITLIVNELEKALPQVIGAAFEAMDLIKKYLKIALKDKKEEFIWVNPVGFPLYQKYKKSDSKKVNMRFNRKVFIYKKFYETDANDVLKILNAIAPNFIHSIDSSHLLLIAYCLYDKEIYDMCFVHDSFGTNANDLFELIKITKTKFVELHQENHLESYLKSIVSGINTEIDYEILENDCKRGDFDINESLLAKYDFN